MMLKIAENLSFPLEVVTQTVAILARKRSGKSYLMRRFIEQLFRARQQVVVCDPKGDWHGIRSSADGKRPGLPVLIFGGEHADVPLDPHSGELVATLLVQEGISALLDMGHMRKHELRTFMTFFMETLYRLKAQEKYRTPMMLGIDEADMIAPQKPQTDEARMLGALDDIVRRGGQRGIGCLFATQRSAVVNKNILSQLQILIALRTIAPQDLKAMDAWIENHGTTEQRGILMKSLPALPIGTAWFWSPGWPDDDGIFKCAKVLPIETFDSGATPKPGQKVKAPKTVADIDLSAVRRQMAETLERAKADDPKALRAEIVSLKKQISEQRPDITKNAPRTVEIKQVERLLEKCETARERLATVHGKFTKAVNELHSIVLAANKPKNVLNQVSCGSRAVQQLAHVGLNNAPPTNLGRCETAILTTLRMYGPCELGRLTLLSGYRASGGFKNSLSVLRTAGLIDGANSSVIQITDAGFAATPADAKLPQGDALRQHWLNQFGVCEKAILTALLDKPDGLAITDLCAKTNYRPSGGFKNALSVLRTAGVLVGGNSEVMRASEELLA